MPCYGSTTPCFLFFLSQVRLTVYRLRRHSDSGLGGKLQCILGDSAPGVLTGAPVFLAHLNQT